MTILTNTYTRFDLIGGRESLSNIVDNISPTDTPFLTNSGVTKATAVFNEWLTDSLATAVSTNQQLEGNNITSYTAVVAAVRLGNYEEIASKTASLSGTVQAAVAAGGVNTMGYQVAKAAKELKRDMETSLLANKAASAGNTTTARVSAGLPNFIKTNYDKAADGTIPTYTSVPNALWIDGTERAFTETITKNVLQQCYTSGADTSTILLGAFNKQAFSGFAGVVELMANQGKSQATIIGAADGYVSDWGKLSIVPDRFQPASRAFFIDWDRVKVAYYRPFTTIPLAKTGDADNRLVLVEYGLQVTNEKGLGAAMDLTTA